MFMTCDITSCSLQSCTWSLSYKINQSHETSESTEGASQQYDG